MLSLVSEKGRKKVKKEYKIRFFSVVLIMLSFVMVVWIIALSPTFIKVFYEHKLLKDTVSGVESADLLEEKKIIDDKFSDLQAKVNALDIKVYDPTELIKEVTDHQIRSVSLSGIVFEKRDSKYVLILQGIANNRESLSEFAFELEKSDLFTQVDLPFSNFAKDSDIPFVLTINLKPLEK